MRPEWQVLMRLGEAGNVPSNLPSNPPRLARQVGEETEAGSARWITRGHQPKRKEPGWDEDPGLLTLVFFLLYHRCNVEKVPSNSQLEIEGNRSGSVLYSRVSKYRYPLVHQTDWFPKDSVFGSKFLRWPPDHPSLEWEVEAQIFSNTCRGLWSFCAVL